VLHVLLSIGCSAPGRSPSSTIPPRVRSAPLNNRKRRSLSLARHPRLVPRLSGSRLDTAQESPGLRSIPHCRHGRTCSGHPRVCRPAKNTWMRVTSTRMTILRGGCCEEAQPDSLNRTAVDLFRPSTVSEKNTWTPGTSPGVTIEGDGRRQKTRSRPTSGFDALSTPVSRLSRGRRFGRSVVGLAGVGGVRLRGKIPGRRHRDLLCFALARGLSERMRRPSTKTSTIRKTPFCQPG
jgi:hypothetical protein